MAVEVLVPEMGEAGMELVFVQWFKAEGDEVVEGEPLFEVDTAKTQVEIEAYGTGVLHGVRVGPGDPIEPRQVLATLLAPGEEPPPTAVVARQSPAVAEPASPGGASSNVAQTDVALSNVVPDEPAVVTPAEAATRQRLSPRARREAALAAARPRPVRNTVAEATTRSWREIPHFHLEFDADVTDAVASLRPAVVLFALLARAMRQHPECNLAWCDGRLVRRDTIDIGLLVDTRNGLLLPTIGAVDTLNYGELRDAIAGAAERARQGKLVVADQSTRSATISNLGMYAVDRFAGVIAAPDPLLLAAGRVRETARWSAGQWTPHKVMTLTLSMDHRAFDGADGARLLSTMETLLQDRERWHA